MNKSLRNMEKTKYDVKHVKQSSAPDVLCISSDSEDSICGPQLVIKPQPIIVSLDSGEETDLVVYEPSSSKVSETKKREFADTNLTINSNESSNAKNSDSKSKRKEIVEISLEQNKKMDRSVSNNLEMLENKSKRKLRDELNLSISKKVKYDISTDIVINTTDNQADDKQDNEQLPDANAAATELTAKRKNKKKKKKSTDFALIQQEVFTEIRKKMITDQNYSSSNKQGFVISKDRRAPPKWTEEMKSFYFDPIPSNRKMDLQVMQTKMSAYGSWEVDPADYHRKISFRSKGRYMGVQADRQLRCTNCDSNRHDLSECPRPDQRKFKTCCNMCGKQGHLGDRCPETRCLNCYGPSSRWVSKCSSCRSQYDSECHRCKRRGHSSDQCSDLWRQFHATVVPAGPPAAVKAKTKQWNQLWCCNCARQGHVYEDCRNYSYYKYPKMSSHVSKYDKKSFNFSCQKTATSSCQFAKVEWNGKSATTTSETSTTTSKSSTTVQMPNTSSSDDNQSETVINGNSNNHQESSVNNESDFFSLDKLPSVKTNKFIEVLPKKLSKNTKRLSKQLHTALSVFTITPDVLETEILFVLRNSDLQGHYPLSLVASMQYVMICLVGHFGLNDGFATLKQLKQMTVEVLKKKERFVTITFLQRLQNYYDSIFSANCKVADVLQLVDKFLTSNPEFKTSDLLKNLMGSYKTKAAVGLFEPQNTS